MSVARARVAVTAMGAVSPFGIGADALCRGVFGGACAAGPTPPSPRRLYVRNVAAVVGEHSRGIDEIVDARFLRRLSRFSRHAVGAAALCVKDAIGCGKGAARWTSPEDAELRDATAVVLGTCYGSSAYHFEYYEKLFRNGVKDASPILFSESVMNAASGHISIHLKLRGASLALVGGEEVGLTAIADAAERIRLGESHAALAGGAEEYCDFVHRALADRGLVGGEPGIPYSGAEGGTFFAEGAAFLLLEDFVAARKAGARILAVLSGCGASRSLDGPSGAGSAVERAVVEALEDAGAEPETVDLVVTSACGGPMDFLEADGIARALRVGRDLRPREVLLAAPKAALGEAFAFTSAAQALVAVRALETQTVPGTAGRAIPARLPRGLHLDFKHVDSRLSGVLAVSVSRGGNAAAVLFQQAAAEGPGVTP